jgi:hypothetical protein
VFATAILPDWQETGARFDCYLSEGVLKCGFVSSWEPVMTTLILDKDTIRRMNNLAEELRICDESGQTLGRFIPERRIASPYSDEELDAIEKEPGGRTLAEILHDLEKR